jgi:Flp pilus assembly protein TadG
MVEFALIFPVIILIILGIFDLGRGVYAYNTLANAARLGARIATVNQIPSSPLGDCDETRPVEAVLTAHWSVKTCAALSATSLGIPESAVSVSYTPPPGTTLTCSPVKVGCIATVTVSYSFSAITPVIGTIVGPIAMSSTSEEPVERVFP